MFGILGKEPLTSDLILFLELGILLVLLIILKYRNIKTRSHLSRHHNIMVIVTILGLAGTLFVMIPSFFNYVSGKIDLLSFETLFIILHICIGTFALTFGIRSALNIRTRELRRWMRITIFLWITAIILGIIIFMQIAGLL
jgi:hypothetical protein